MVDPSIHPFWWFLLSSFFAPLFALFLCCLISHCLLFVSFRSKFFIQQGFEHTSSTGSFRDNNEMQVGHSVPQIVHRTLSHFIPAKIIVQIMLLIIFSTLNNPLGSYQTIVHMREWTPNAWSNFERQVTNFGDQKSHHLFFCSNRNLLLLLLLLLKAISFSSIFSSVWNNWSMWDCHSNISSFFCVKKTMQKSQRECKVLLLISHLLSRNCWGMLKL